MKLEWEVAPGLLEEKKKPTHEIAVRQEEYGHTFSPYTTDG